MENLVTHDLQLAMAESFSFWDDEKLPDASTIPEAWQDFFKDFFATKEGKELRCFIEKQYRTKASTTAPDRRNVFRCFTFFPPEQCKLVILGQDPYPTPKQANGLAFSSGNGSLPQSLQNIFKELAANTGKTIRKDTDLQDWAKQGVLLLNTALTVEHGKRNCHKDQWHDFTQYVIEKLMSSYKNIVFIIWGGNAKNAVRDHKDYMFSNKHVILESAHPSPLSANKGFFGCKCFSKANKYLQKMGKDPIQWQ